MKDRLCCDSKSIASHTTATTLSTMNSTEVSENKKVSESKKKDVESKKKSSSTSSESAKKSSSDGSSKKQSPDTKKSSDTKQNAENKKSSSDSKKSKCSTVKSSEHRKSDTKEQPDDRNGKRSSSEKKESSDAKKKSSDDKKKSSDEKRSSSDSKKRSSDDKKNSNESKKKSSDDKKSEDKKSTSESKKKSSDEKKNASDSRKKSSDDKKSEERKSSSEGKRPSEKKKDSGSKKESESSRSKKESDSPKEPDEGKRKNRTGRLKPAMGSFDAFNLEATDGGHLSDCGEDRPRPRPRPRRRNSLGGTSGAPSTGFDGFGETSGAPPKGAENGGIPVQRPPAAARGRRVPRRGSALGHAGADAVANFVSASFHGGSATDYGYGEYGMSAPAAAEMYGYGDETAPVVNGSNMFATDFGNFGNNGVGGRPVGVRRSSFAGRSDAPKADGNDVSAKNQRKLIDDITGFSSAESKSGNTLNSTRGGGAGNNFTLPMTEAAPSEAGGRRGPRRRASLGIGSGFANQNHQQLEVDDEKLQGNKMGFFKDRGEKGKSKGSGVSRNKSSEDLTGYDADRDRRRFMN